MNNNDDIQANEQVIKAWSDAAAAHANDYDDEGDIPKKLLHVPSYIVVHAIKA